MLYEVITVFQSDKTMYENRPSDYGVQSGALQLEVTPMEGLRLIAGLADDRHREKRRQARIRRHRSRARSAAAVRRGNVITSYSIHYTKLYDDADDDQHRADSNARPNQEVHVQLEVFKYLLKLAEHRYCLRT